MKLTCQCCATEFVTKNSNRKYCSVACGVKSRNRPNWHQYDKRECLHCKKLFEIISWRKKKFCTSACSAEYQRGKATGRRIDDAKLRRKRVARIKINGRAIFLHRHMVEQSIGRQLLPTETVHHIDCDSFNNELSNLHLFSNEQEHQLAHWSIERLVPSLLKSGVIKFEGGVYRLGDSLPALAVAITAAQQNDRGRS